MQRHRSFESVGLLYDAALGHASWHDATAGLIQAVDGSTLRLTAQYSPGGAIDGVDMHGFTPQEVELYAREYIADDLWLSRALNKRLFDQAFLNTEVVSEMEWLHGRFYTDLCKQYTDTFHGVSAGGSIAGGGLYMLGIHRPRRAKAFSEDTKAVLQPLLAHIGRALYLRSRLMTADTQAKTFVEAFDRLSFGVIQLDGRGRLVQANQAAHEILASGDGLSLAALGLRASLHGENDQLQRAIAQAGSLTTSLAGGGVGPPYLRVSRPSGRKSYAIVVAPLGLDRVVLSAAAPSVMVIVTDPDGRQPLDAKVLMATFGFTPAEAGLVAQLAVGKPLPAIAQALGIGHETARTLLARARAKAGADSQTDLVRIVLLALSSVASSYGPR